MCSAAYIGALTKPRVVLTDPSAVNNQPSFDDGLMFYLSVYGGLAGANSILTLIRAFLFAYGGIEAAVVLHSHLLAAILKVKRLRSNCSVLMRSLLRLCVFVVVD